MKTAGIIAEYNPFHNGHKYHIEETRRLSGADYVIAVMSGDFVQRGAPAVFDKYTRTRMVLNNGIDLVIELPTVAALSSAEGFATGGVSILNGLGVVDTLSFGSESDPAQLSDMQTIAAILANEPETYREKLSECLKQGQSYPLARQHAIESCLGSNVDSLLSSPNNILALEYLKAIHQKSASLTPLMIPRKGSSYHEDTLAEEFSSATAIRHFLAQASPAESDWKALRQSVPADVFSVLKTAHTMKQYLTEDAFSDMLFYALLEKTADNTDYLPTLPSLFARIKNQLEHYSGWSEYCALLKTKNQTYTAISRSLAQILLHIGQTEMKTASRCSCAPYARILGFRKSAAPLLQEIHTRSTLPVITRLADADSILNTDQKALLAIDLRAASLYNYLRHQVSGTPYVSEFRHPLVYL